MTKIPRYKYACSDAMAKFLLDGNKYTLAEKLKGCEEDLRLRYPGKDLYFLFGENDTKLSVIKEVMSDLNQSPQSLNYRHRIDQFTKVTKDLNPENELIVLY